MKVRFRGENVILTKTELDKMNSAVHSIEQLEPALKYAIIHQYNQMADEAGINRDNPNEFRDQINGSELHAEFFLDGIRLGEPLSPTIMSDCIPGLGDHNFLIYMDDDLNILKIDLMG